MPRAKRSKPNDLKTIHDRRSTDLLRNAVIGLVVVDDPYPLDLGDKIEAVRSLKDDPLAQLHNRRYIDEAQFLAGRAFQEDFERIERGAQAVDPSKPYVDSSRRAVHISDAYSKAFARLNVAERKLGASGSALTHDVLIARKTYAQVSESRGFVGERWEKYFGMRFRECLDCLALVYGYAMEKRR